MNIWRRAAGALKDGNSLLAADDDGLKIAVVKATSHDEFSMDSDNAEIIYRFVRTSPSSIKPLVRAISSRVGRTRSWPVALKGLMLMHGFFLGRVPAADSIGRLPFDLSGFGRSCRFTLFVRAYFVFLDQRSILFHDANLVYEESSVMIQLAITRKMQNLLDSLMRIKPIAEDMRTPLILEAMDNVITEILQIYNRICREMAQALPKVHSKTGKHEAEMALKVVTKSISHGEDLSKYFEFCKEFGVPKAHEIPDFVRIPEADVIELGNLIHGVPVTDRSEKEERPTVVAEMARDELAEKTEAVETKQNEVPDLIKLDQERPEDVSHEIDEIPDLISL